MGRSLMFIGFVLALATAGCAGAPSLLRPAATPGNDDVAATESEDLVTVDADRSSDPAPMHLDPTLHHAQGHGLLGGTHGMR